MANVTPLPPPSLGKLAEAEFRRRQAKARGLVRSRSLSRGAAEQALRPWLAIACLCGAEMPELVEMIAEDRVHQVDGPGGVTDAEARTLVARDICARSRWVGPLATARDAAIEAHHSLHGMRERGLAKGRPTVPDEAEVERARIAASALSRIAAALAFAADGKHPVPPFQPRHDAQAREAA